MRAKTMHNVVPYIDIYKLYIYVLVYIYIYIYIIIKALIYSML